MPLSGKCLRRPQDRLKIPGGISLEKVRLLRERINQPIFQHPGTLILRELGHAVTLDAFRADDFYH